MHQGLGTLLSSFVVGGADSFLEEGLELGGVGGKQWPASQECGWVSVLPFYSEGHLPGDLLGNCEQVLDSWKLECGG